MKTKKKENIIGLRELRENTEKYIKATQKGESFTVVRRAKPVFRIEPLDADNDDGWETVIDFTEIDPRGVPVEALIERLEKYGR